MRFGRTFWVGAVLVGIGVAGLGLTQAFAP